MKTGSTIQGAGAIRFTDLFRDTVETHGAAWARKYYTRRGLPGWEVNFWFLSCGYTN